MKVRLLVAWQQFHKGHVIPEMPAAQAELLVRRGFAEYAGAEARSPVAEAMSAGGEYLTRTLSAASEVVQRAGGRSRKA